MLKTDILFCSAALLTDVERYKRRHSADKMRNFFVIYAVESVVFQYVAKVPKCQAGLVWSVSFHLLRSHTFPHSSRCDKLFVKYNGNYLSLHSVIMFQQHNLRLCVLWFQYRWMDLGSDIRILITILSVISVYNDCQCGMINQNICV
jgi:hypothetical protein